MMRDVTSVIVSGWTPSTPRIPRTMAPSPTHVDSGGHEAGLARGPFLHAGSSRLTGLCRGRARREEHPRAEHDGRDGQQDVRVDADEGQDTERDRGEPRDRLRADAAHHSRALVPVVSDPRARADGQPLEQKRRARRDDRNAREHHREHPREAEDGEHDGAHAEQRSIRRRSSEQRAFDGGLEDRDRGCSRERGERGATSLHSWRVGAPNGKSGGVSRVTMSAAMSAIRIASRSPAEKSASFMGSGS